MKPQVVLFDILSTTLVRSSLLSSNRFALVFHSSSSLPFDFLNLMFSAFKFSISSWASLSLFANWPCASPSLDVRRLLFEPDGGGEAVMYEREISKDGWPGEGLLESDVFVEFLHPECLRRICSVR